MVMEWFRVNGVKPESKRAQSFPLYELSSSHSERFVLTARDHSFGAFAKFSEELTFHTPLYAHVLVRIRGKKC